jgi:hypothetical protein
LTQIMVDHVAILNGLALGTFSDLIHQLGRASNSRERLTLSRKTSATLKNQSRKIILFFKN